ncbi:hypothetical protein HU200_034834 [Digitaria exilis]|uniref:Uncharacterized protein n=1 Tax=Digitaria exilis TaxID=1010633 RepID=A0A835ELT4_9POAL|nr:hypothetical protein HU200_034825 [Digitaria exilis]KAF8699002.1 hypothetical protein HU200_034834 [Digitaria exilis]
MAPCSSRASLLRHSERTTGLRLRPAASSSVDGDRRRPGQHQLVRRRLRRHRAHVPSLHPLQSWVAFPDDGGVLVGDDARNYAAVNPEAAAFSGFKRLLGQRLNRHYEGDFVQRVIENLPYKVVENDVRPHIQMEAKDVRTARQFSIEEMTSAIFAKLKDMANGIMLM